MVIFLSQTESTPKHFFRKKALHRTFFEHRLQAGIYHLKNKIEFLPTNIKFMPVISALKCRSHINNFRNPLTTTQKTHCYSIPNINLLMLFQERVFIVKSTQNARTHDVPIVPQRSSRQFTEI